MEALFQGFVLMVALVSLTLAMPVLVIEGCKQVKFELHRFRQWRRNRAKCCRVFPYTL
jgi:hypothetical protein